MSEKISLDSSDESTLFEYIRTVGRSVGNSTDTPG